MKDQVQRRKEMSPTMVPRCKYPRSCGLSIIEANISASLEAAFMWPNWGILHMQERFRSG